MQAGTLNFTAASGDEPLIARPVANMITRHSLEAYIAEIDPELSDTAAFCTAYGIGMAVSANCVIVEAKRADRVWYAACMILATDRIDINGIVRRQLDARKISFAPMETAVRLTGMEYGGITPVGLPAGWPILIDEAVVRAGQVIVGSGRRCSKLLIASESLVSLPNAIVRAIAKDR